VAAQPLFPLQCLLHNGLRGYAGMVCAWHPQDIAPAHAMPASQGVLHGHITTCAHCQPRYTVYDPACIAAQRTQMS
jgi:hypothetical protein